MQIQFKQICFPRKRSLVTAVINHTRPSTLIFLVLNLSFHGRQSYVSMTIVPAVVPGKRDSRIQDGVSTSISTPFS